MKCKRCQIRNRAVGKTRCQYCIDKTSKYNKNYHKDNYQKNKDNQICITCGNKNLTGRIKCQECSDRANELERSRYGNVINIGICGICQKAPQMKNKKFCQGCLDQRKATMNGERIKALRAKRRKQILDHYGHWCNCCGQTGDKFLTYDHVNNDGADHRRSLTNDAVRNGSNYLILWIINNDFPDSIQILCWNCNCAKERNGGVCPHSEFDIKNMKESSKKDKVK